MKPKTAFFSSRCEYLFLRNWLPIMVCLYGSTVLGQDTSQPKSESQTPTNAEKLFALKVQPLFREKCLSCHGEKPDAIESDFDIRTRESTLRGGDSYGEDVLKPGDAAASFLYTSVRRTEEGFEMPPKEAEKLTEEETHFVREWIEGGAPWPTEERLAWIYENYAEGIVWKTSGGLSEEWTNRKYKREDLWAYQPIQRPEIPDRSNPIDFLIGAQLKRRGLTAAGEADRLTLIRRATFDLLGLPPTPREVQDFVDNPQPNDEAFAKLVDRLLESPHYGEQWGRHWLDVVRYADSSGFANDWERPNAWRYRDYVIRAFNDDKPYDQFVLEQIAGDELYDQALASQEGSEGRSSDSNSPDASPSLLIAAGFLRMGPWEHTGMSVAKITRQMYLDDITDSVGQVFLAHALQCARCHDHKFDPIPTQDYYSMQAIFATTQFAETDAAWLPEENLAGLDDDRRYHKMRLAANKESLAKTTRLKNEAERKWLAERNLPYKSAAEAKKAGAPPEHVPPTTQLLSPDVFGAERIGRKWAARFSWELDRYEPLAFTVFNGKTFHGKHSVRLAKPDDPMKRGTLENTTILVGGDPFANGQPVVPAVLSSVLNQQTHTVTNQPVGRRTDLARWITSQENTLTARVMANRIWLYHFGQGIAGNPNNFGATGKKPTHPKLLDWLASELVASGWSIKHLHRTIMNSATYRRASLHHAPEKMLEIDPNGTSYAAFQPRRLAAEEIRDSMLAVSGELIRTRGGIPVRPDMNLEAALQPRMIMGTFAPSYVPNPKPEQRNRRTVYALKLRGQRDPFLETFNQPGTDKSCELRDNSTVTPQALTMLNSDETSDRALAFAQSVLKSAATKADAVDRIFRLAYGRSPSAQELKATIDHWQKMTKIQENVSHKPRKNPTEVVRRAVEENTGEPFEFKETLFVYRDYQPDLQPEQVDAQTRGLADVCLAILNSNEFVFVY